LLEALRKKGAPQVVLEVAWGNTNGRQFFESLGFRPVMTEMARDLGAPSKRVPPSLP
jgi:ribosomal protein S18 acetylase RimI-like enzyme